MWGRLEHEIRLLPQVVAVTITPNDVVVLVEPGADAHAVAAAVESVVDGHGARHRVKVVGGAEPIAVRMSPSGRRWAIAAGAAAASFAIAVGQLTGASGPVVHPPHAIAPSIDIEPVSPPKRHVAIELVAEHHVAAAAHLPRVAITPVSAPPAIVPTPVHTTVVEVESCNGPGARGAARDMPGGHRGNGPKPWSRSVMVAPHDLCEHGRP